MYNVSNIQGKRLRAVLLSSTNEFQDHHEHHLHLSKLQGGKSGRRMFARLFSNQTWRQNISLPLTFCQVELKHIDTGTSKKLGRITRLSAQEEEDLESKGHLPISAKDHVHVTLFTTHVLRVQ